jgi:type II secretory pathway pseudopilin PulG
VLIGLIVVMSIMAVLGAAMLTLYSSSSFSQTAYAGGLRAYFLAESGFRYAANRYLEATGAAAKLTAMSNMNNLTCNLLNNDGSFNLRVHPYWFTVSSVSGTGLTVQVHGELESSLALSSGYLWINNARYPYTGASGAAAGATSFTFVASSNWPTFPADTDVYSAALPNAAQTVTQKGNLTLSGTGVGAFPLINGNFRLGSSPNVYTYQKRSGNVLVGVDLANSSLTWINLSIDTATNVVLDKFIRLNSRGTSGAYSRQIVYNVPIGWTAGGAGFQKAQHQEPFGATTNWQAPAGGGGGTHSIATIDGGPALKVDSTSSVSGLGSLAMLFFNSSGALTNLPKAWMDAKGFLTYDIQVKVHNDEPYFMAGMGFRARNSADGADFYTYGLSFVKPRQTRGCFFFCGAWSAPNDLDTHLIPGYTSHDVAGPLFSNPGLFQNLEETSQPTIGTQSRYGLPAIVLWQRTSAGNKWLAYRTLTTADGIVTFNSGTDAWRLVNWSTLIGRVVEGYSLTFNSGGGLSGTGVPIKAGDTIRNVDGSKSARVVMTPILTAGSWAARNAQGTFVLANIDGAFAAGDNLFVGSTQLATANGNLDATKRNYIRAGYAGPTALGTANAVQTDNNRLANPRNSANWPPDDLTDLAASNDAMTLVQWTGTPYSQGAEMAPSLTAGNWTLGGGWRNPIVAGSGLQKNASGTGTARPNPALAITAGVTYDVSITVTNRTAGSFTYSLGGFTSSAISANGTYTDTITATTTGNLVFTPTNTSRFAITAVSVHPRISTVVTLTSTSEPDAVIRSSDLVTGTWTTSSTAADFSGDSISLLTLSGSAASTYYDDFAIQLFLKSGTGFLPPIQQ